MASNNWRKRATGKVNALLSRGLTKGATSLHAALYRRSGGRVGGKVSALPVLLLTTTGRKTGVKRTVPLTYTRDGDNYVVVASNSGRPSAPLWSLNLQSNPNASIEVGRIAIPVEARQAGAEEQARLWARLISKAQSYEEYRKRTSRRIPMVILQPVKQSGSSK